MSREPGIAAQAAPARRPPYRRAIPITDEMRQHCHIYLDEQLYISALTLLTDLVTSGASHPDCHQRPTFAPVPFHIELISALLIHPRHTNQAPPNERLELASRAINFLRNALSILGPLNARLGEAFSFSPIATTSRTSRRSRNALENEDDSSSSDSEDRPERMRGIIANKGRIRRCAKDFWHMVGWAFNCSVKYPKRWKYWMVWLDFMLDVLDADWEERESQDSLNSGASKNTRDEAESSLRKCLLVKYLAEAKGRSSAVKRIVRSAFADGRSDSLREFPEVFQNETRELKAHRGQKRKREDPMDRKFGDYDDDADTAAESSEFTDQTPEPLQDNDDSLANDPWLGGTESIALRQRLLALFSRVAAVVPECFADCIDVYDIIYECVRPLPLPSFSLLLSPSSSSQLPTVVFVSLTQLLLLRFLPLSAPRPESVVHRENDDLSQEVLERCFLPFPANTSSTVDNAKVSMLVEIQFRQFLKSCTCYHRPSLDRAIEKGILARENKIKGDKRRKESGVKMKDEENDREWLKASSVRLRSLLLWVEQSSGDN